MASESTTVGLAGVQAEGDKEHYLATGYVLAKSKGDTGQMMAMAERMSSARGRNLSQEGTE